MSLRTYTVGFHDVRYQPRGRAFFSVLTYRGEVIEKLRRYSERFLKLARERLEIAFEQAGRDDGAERLYRELHALAGEAAMLQLPDIAAAARQSEADALARELEE